MNDTPALPHALVEFLAALGANNSREWFGPRKAEYRALVVEPLADVLARGIEEASPLYRILANLADLRDLGDLGDLGDRP